MFLHTHDQQRRTHIRFNGNILYSPTKPFHFPFFIQSLFLSLLSLCLHKLVTLSYVVHSMYVSLYVYAYVCVYSALMVCMPYSSIITATKSVKIHN